MIDWKRVEELKEEIGADGFVEVAREFMLAASGCESGAAVRAYEFTSELTCFGIVGLVHKHHIVGAVRTGENLGPDHIVDTAFALSVGVQGFVHPTEFRIDLLKETIGSFLELTGRNIQIEVVGDEIGNW